jgi:hypothetical protein
VPRAQFLLEEMTRTGAGLPARLAARSGGDATGGAASA